MRDFRRRVPVLPMRAEARFRSWVAGTQLLRDLTPG